jgi:pimeloyl-ACP methyl ester carboxylesterase
MVLDAGTEAGFGNATTGNDLIQGTNGQEQIFGNTGNDLIYGNHGEDTIAGEEGFDTLYGGQGADVFQLVEGGNPDTIADLEAGVDSIQLPSGLTGEDVTLNEGTLSVNATGEVLAQVKGDVSTDDLLNDPAARLEDSVALAKQQLSEFANREDFAAQVQQNFGNVDVEAAQRLISDLIAGENTPNIEILSQEQLQGVSGGYDSVTGTVYLSQDLLATSDASQVADVVLEEWGHHLDAQLGNGDTPGDEGAEFSKRVQGELLPNNESNVVQTEDDTISINLDSQTVEIETANLPSPQGNYRWKVYPSHYWWDSFGDEFGIRETFQANPNGWGWQKQTQTYPEIPIERSDGSVGINEYYGRRSPRGVNSEEFKAWTYLTDHFQAGETYKFLVTADDLAALTVNKNGEQEIISNWEDAHNGKQYTWTPEESGEYVVQIGHVENGGDAQLNVYWDNISENKSNSGNNNINYGSREIQVVDDDWLGYGTEKTMKLELVNGDNIENKPTWFVLHGFNSSPSASNISDLTQTLKSESNAQIITVDWSSMSRQGAPVNVRMAADWIEEVGEALADFIQSDESLSPDNVNLVGHSLGAYVAWEVSEHLDSEGNVDRLVALDPAAQDWPTTGRLGYDTSDVNFSENADWSWGFYGSTFGSDDTALTAHESFELRFGFDAAPFTSTDSHGQVVAAFADLIESNPDEEAFSNKDITKYFDLEQINPDWEIPEFLPEKPWVRHDGFEVKELDPVGDSLIYYDENSNPWWTHTWNKIGGRVAI